MYKKLLIIAVLLHFVSTVFSQLPVGEWQVFPSFNTPTNITETKDKIYFVADHFLYVYDKEDQSITPLSVKNGLSDNGVKDIYYNYSDNYLVITYSNSNIDIIDRNDKIYNISDIKYEVLSSSKNINDVFFANEIFYLSTDFGIVVVNFDKKEIKETYSFDAAIHSIAFFKNAIYAASSKGVYKADMNANLFEKSNWKINQTLVAKKLIGLSSYLIFQDFSNSIWLCNSTESVFLLRNDPTSIKQVADFTLFYSANEIIKYDTHLTELDRLPATNKTDVTSFNSNNIYWIISKNGLYSIKKDNNNILTSDTIKLNQSKVIEPLNLTFANNTLYTASGGPHYYKEQYNPGHISVLKENNWINITPKDVPVFMTDFQFGDLYNIAVSPTNPETFYIGTWLEGLYKFSNYKFDKVYNKKTTGDVLLPFDNWAYKISGLTFDKNNNLWMLNMSRAAATIKILKPDDKWEELKYKELFSYESLEKLLIPKYSNSTTKFIVARYDNDNTRSFVFAFDEGGTFNNSNDDKYAVLNPFIDQDNNTIESTFYCSIAEDLNGQIWIGTNRGPIIIQNPSAVFNKNFKSTRIKIPRNDGSNFADFLLQSEKINTIAVDGANRKWLGTEKSGLYLVSENGLETIHHFSTENSPLPSDNIISLAINPTSGEVYIGTDKGLVSYRSDATEGSADYSNVYAFPNPVRPDYEGWITVTGMQENSLVKITDTSGNLFFQDTSKGGQITWNGRNKNGDRVKSGVYLVFASSEDGKSGVATKIVVVN